jgi:hypothetical protein
LVPLSRHDAVAIFAAAVAKLRDAGLDPHTDVPSGEEIDRGATASIFVQHASLGHARAVLGLQT